ncbi:MAG: FHA domain-containing protein [Rubripirellula sp.]
MSARLILAVGSRAGLEAPLRAGYYMIGRHNECQIRPKSRSVSRRHCLLHHDEDGLRVMDLDSSAGAYVNSSRLQPRKWYDLSNGSELRCGKVLFQIGLEDGSESPAPMSEASAVSTGGPSMLRGEPWHDVDVAGFLETEDTADRERRYDDIRATHDSTEDSDVFADDSALTVTDDVDAFEDVFSDDAIPPSSGPKSEMAANTTRQSSQELDRRNPGKAAAVPSKSNKRGRLPKAKRKKLDRRSWSVSVGGADQWKLIGAVVLAVGMMGLFGMKAYQLYSGPDVRVIQGID